MEPGEQSSIVAAAGTVRVRLFASLREQVGWGERQLPLQGCSSAISCWQQLKLGGEALPAGIRVAINHHFASADSPVQAGDELAFLPPISGG